MFRRHPSARTPRRPPLTELQAAEGQFGAKDPRPLQLKPSDWGHRAGREKHGQLPASTARSRSAAGLGPPQNRRGSTSLSARQAHGLEAALAKQGGCPRRASSELQNHGRGDDPGALRRRGRGAGAAQRRADAAGPAARPRGRAFPRWRRRRAKSRGLRRVPRRATTAPRVDGARRGADPAARRAHRRLRRQSEKSISGRALR